MLRLLAAGLLLLAFAPHVFAGFDPQRADFRVVIDALENPYRVLAVPVMPEARVAFRSPDRPVEALELRSAHGTLGAIRGNRWWWQAPSEPGVYPLEIRERATGETMLVNLLVMTPRVVKTNGRIERYRIGRYPRTPHRGLDVYRPPPGFVRVDRGLVNLPVSPHFTLGQFLSKQDAAWPQFVLVRPELLLVLERTLEAVNEAGIRADRFAVLSGYRTPFYNAAIGNGHYSRHQWGGAADIYIDQRAPHGRMDDLDGDGREGIGDARLLAGIVEQVLEEMELEGGIGIYGPAPHRGAFVHVDVRGFTARWTF